MPQRSEVLAHDAVGQLSGLLDSAMDAIVTVDESQKIVIYNAAAERIFGWMRAEVSGQPLSMLIPQRLRDSHEQKLRQFGATGVSSRRMGGSARVFGLRKGGEEFPVDASISQLHTDKGKLYTVVLRDVSERVRAESEQARLAARLAGLLDSAMDAIITVDDNQHIILYNRAAEKIFGWPQVQVMGHSLDMLIPARFRPAHRGHLAQFAATGVTSRRMGAQMVIFGMRRSGEEFPIEASISQLDTDEGKLYTVILRDVTERVRAQEDLAALAMQAHDIREQEKGRVARELHDDLAQALSAAKIDAAWLKSNHSTSDAADAKFDDMIRMLDGAVTSTRRIAADLRPLILDDLGFLAAMDWLARSFEQRHGVRCELHTDATADVSEPYATVAFRMAQESLSNIAKHARAKNVKMIVTRVDGALRIRVIDDGIGFDSTAPRKAESLGLAGLRERARLVKGSVVVTSTPGQGTTMDAYIPLARL